jgi:16S rRNA (cytidine1402-2'-O)-methyltransferase
VSRLTVPLNGTVPLVLAATPIGDPDDASPRLRRALETAEVIAAEDTRRLHRLAAMLGVTLTGRVVAVYDAVERTRAAALLDEVRHGRTVLVVTDAGMPLVSDPGHVLVTEAIAAGLPVTVIPGPSAVTAAIAVAGIPVDRFCVEGFLPRRAGERRTRLGAVAVDSRALVLFEAPHRLAATLADVADVLGGERRAAVCRELTKTHEQVLRGTLAELAAWAAESQVRGEITVVIAGATGQRDPVDDAVLAAEVAEWMAQGRSRRDAVDQVAAAHGLARRVVYAVATTRPPR